MDQKITPQDDVEVKGQYILTFCDVTSKKAKTMQQKVLAIAERGRKVVQAARNTPEFEDIQWSAWQEYCKARDEFHHLFATRQVKIENLVPNAGLAVLARRLAGDTTYSGEINYCVLGTDATAAAAGDTTLGTEVFRKLVSSQAFNANQAFISTFFTAGDDADTYQEVGHVIDGGAGADTGQLSSRIASPDTAELPVTKSLSESLTVDYRTTYQNA